MGWGGERGALPEALSSFSFEVAALRTQEVTQEVVQCQFSETDLWEEGQASRTDRLQELAGPGVPMENNRCLDV